MTLQLNNNNNVYDTNFVIKKKKSINTTKIKACGSGQIKMYSGRISLLKILKTRNKLMKALYNDEICLISIFFL